MHFPLFEDEGKSGEEGEMANLFTIFDAQTETVDQRQAGGGRECGVQPPHIAAGSRAERKRFSRRKTWRSMEAITSTCLLLHQVCRDWSI